MKSAFVERLVAALNRIADPSSPDSATDADSPATGASSPSSEESSALNQLASSAVPVPIPKSVTALHGHPLYVLERHIGKYQAIYPAPSTNGESSTAAPVVVGELNGERVYRRSALQTLHTREGWLKEARDVRPEERGRPAKMVRARENPRARKRRLEAAAASASAPQNNCSRAESSSNASASFSTGARTTASFGAGTGGLNVTTIIEDERPQVALFGRWQTVRYEPPVAHHPHVPKNEFGNIYLFQPQMLPVGTVHLRRLTGQRPPRVAQELGIDIAPALTGIAFL